MIRDVVVRALVTLVLAAIIVVMMALVQRGRTRHQTDPRTSLRADLRASLKDLDVWPVTFIGLALLVVLWSDTPSWKGIAEDQDASGGELLWGRVELSDFWARHTVWATVLVGLLTAGLIYYAWQSAHERTERLVAERISGAGLAGIVDFLVDAEIVLALTGSSKGQGRAILLGGTPVQAPERALKKDVVRAYRERVGTGQSDDVRLKCVEPSDGSIDRWHHDLIDAAVRRVAKAMNEWAPTISQSTYGRDVLFLLAAVRIELVNIANDLQKCGTATELASRVLHVRRKLRFLALFCEYASGADPARSEIVPGRQGLTHDDASVGWSALFGDSETSTGFARSRGTWGEAWKKALKEMTEDPEAAAPAGAAPIAPTTEGTHAS